MRNLGSKNKIKRPLTSTLTLEERLKIISNLIVDRIIEEQNLTKNGQPTKS